MYWSEIQNLPCVLNIAHGSHWRLCLVHVVVVSVQLLK